MHRERADEAPPEGVVTIDPALFFATGSARGRKSAGERLSVALVTGESLKDGLAAFADTTPLTPANWRDELVPARPDLLLLTASGPLAKGEWGDPAHGFEPLDPLLEACRESCVPIVFFADLDPRWYFRYLPLAAKADHLVTTDVACLDGYRFELGHRRVHHLAHGVDTVKYSPVQSGPREEAFVYVAERDLGEMEGAKLTTLIEAAARYFPVRVFEARPSEEEPFRLPPAASSAFAGVVGPEEIPRLLRRYAFGLALCAFDQSQSAVEDAVLRLAASGTAIVCNYSAASRNHFGDLLISSDDPGELARRLGEWEGAPERRDKLAHLALRKTLSQHGFASRLASLVAGLTGFPLIERGERITLLGFAQDQKEADRLQAAFERQTHKNARLALVGPETLQLRLPGATLHPTVRAARGELLLADLVAPVSASDYHGPDYLADLCLMKRHFGCEAVGKDLRYRLDGQGRVQLNHGERHKRAARLRATASLLGPEKFPFESVAGAADLENLLLTGEGLYAADEFGYCEGGACADEALVAARVDDPARIDRGLTLEGHPLLEALMEEAGERRPPEVKPVLEAEELHRHLPRNLPEGIEFRLADGEVEIVSTLAKNEFRYLYNTRHYTLDELGLTGGGCCQAFTATPFDLGIALMFLDRTGTKLGTALIQGGRLTGVNPPEGTASVALGFRIKGPGSTRLQRIAFYDTRQARPLIVPRSRCLILTAHYPAYGDLYRYGFLHARVRAYKESGTLVDVFQETPKLATRYSEFENVDVIHGDVSVLDSLLSQGVHTHVFVHVLNERFWEVLEKYLDRVKVVVWVHGIEIQPWYRRAFNCETVEERKKARHDSEKRLRMWKRILGSVHPNFKMINVSRYHAMEVANDLDVELGDENQEIIPNYVNGKIFAYRTKTADQRKKILSIRPYSSKVYANDLAVRAVELLADEPYFTELEFLFVGDGVLFDETVEPLRKYPNVTLLKKFITQYEIAELHRTHGVFLVPTRGDTQGVSRDEAMSSGLVAVTNSVAAIPDFADETCAMLAGAEDAQGLADAIKELVNDPELFLCLSRKGARRVAELTSRERTIDRELALLEEGAGPDPHRPAIMAPVAHKARLALYSHHDQNKPDTPASLAATLARTLATLPGGHTSVFLNAVIEDTAVIEPLLHLSRGVRLVEPLPADETRLTVDEAVRQLEREDRAKNFSHLIVGGSEPLAEAARHPRLAKRLVPLLDSASVVDGSPAPAVAAALTALKPHRPRLLVEDSAVARAVATAFPELAAGIVLLDAEARNLSWLLENPGEDRAADRKAP